MTADEIVKIQTQFGLSDGKMAKALGVTRQTWRNWRTGRVVPMFAQQSLRWLVELRRLSPSNDNIPEKMRAMAVAAAAMVFSLLDYSNEALAYTAEALDLIF